MRENTVQLTTLHSKDVVIGAHVHKANAQNSDVNAHVAHLRQVTQLKISDFSGDTFKGFEVL